METKLLDKRQLKAIVLQKNIHKIDDVTYAVKSQSSEATYIVARLGLEWSCQCPDYQMRGVVCKHIHAVVLAQTLKARDTIIGGSQTEGVEEAYTQTLACPKCGSIEIIKRGVRKTLSEMHSPRCFPR